MRGIRSYLSKGGTKPNMDTLRRLFLRKPDEVITQHGLPYLERWYLLPPNARFGINIYLHRFRRSDDDRAPHDHPWPSLSFILSGRYVEHIPKCLQKWKEGTSRELTSRICRPFLPKYRPAEWIHRVELVDDKPVWTLFITGRKVRDWGFWCEGGWRGWKEFGRRGCD